MAWDTDLVLILRVLIGDLNDPQKNTDLYLQRILIAAGIIVQNEIELSYDYIFDINNVTITPDPVANGDIVLQALLPLKAACLLNQSQFQVALSQGIKVRDGDSAIDTSVGFRGYRDILVYGPCASYEALKWQLQSANSANVCSAVLSPFRGPNDGAIDTVSWFYDEFFSVVNCNGSRYGRI